MANASHNASAQMTVPAHKGGALGIIDENNPSANQNRRSEVYTFDWSMQILVFYLNIDNALMNLRRFELPGSSYPVLLLQSQ